MNFPQCLQCQVHNRFGLLVPLSDYGENGSEVRYKAWACTDPACGFSIRIDKGGPTYGKKINYGDR